MKDFDTEKLTIFDEQIARKPNRYPWVEQYVAAAHNSFWTHRKFSFQSDVQDFKTLLNEDERGIIIRALATIGQLEIQVKKFWAKLGDNCPHPALYDLGFVLANQEVIHGDAYEALLEKLGIEDAFDDILKLDIIKGRVNYLKKYLHKFHSDNKRQYVYSLILFTIFIENIALFSQFYTGMWFSKEKVALKDLNNQLAYTVFEEDLHAKVGYTLVNEIRKEYPEFFDKELENRIIEESVKAVEYEYKIIEWILGDYSHETLNKEVLYDFIKNRLNNSLSQIGYPKVFTVNEENLKKTTWFEERVNGAIMTDFFHMKPTEYSVSSQSFNEEDLF